MRRTCPSVISYHTGSCSVKFCLSSGPFQIKVQKLVLFKKKVKNICKVQEIRFLRSKKVTVTAYYILKQI
jgi:hypothetical protein